MARPGLTGHRKFRRLARALGSVIVARGVLELLWESCYEAGDDYVGTAEDIEHLVGWTGTSNVLTSALADAGAPEGAGFIESAVGRQGYQVHDLWHHAPDYVTKRRQRELSRQQKAAPNTPRRHTAPNGGGQQPSLDCLDGVVHPPSPSHSPSPSPLGKNVSPEPLRDSAPLLTFPVVGKDGPTWSLSEAHVAEWAPLFPSLNILAECSEALAWIGAHSGRRKTASGMRKFLVGWFTRSNDKGGRKVGPVAVPDRQPWKCLHLERCSNREMCQNKTILGRPERAEAAS